MQSLNSCSYCSAGPLLAGRIDSDVIYKYLNLSQKNCRRAFVRGEVLGDLHIGKFLYVVFVTGFWKAVKFFLVQHISFEVIGLCS